MKHHSPKNTRGGKGLIVLNLNIEIITEVSQDRKLNRAETWMQELLKSWKGSGWLLACFHAFAQRVFYRTQNQQSRDGTNHNWSSLLPLIKKNALQLNVIEDRFPTDWRKEPKRRYKKKNIYADTIAHSWSPLEHETGSHNIYTKDLYC